MPGDAKKPKGRPPKTAHGPDGRPVTNLSATPFKYKTDADGKPILDADGNRVVERWRYFVTGTKPPVWLGFDLKKAIRRLREWEAEQSGTTLVTLDWSNHPPDPPGRKQAENVKVTPEPERVPYKDEHGTTVIPVPKKYRLPEKVFHQLLEEVLADPIKCKRAAEATGRPLDRLEYLPAPRPSPSLESLIVLYEERAQVTLDWRRKARQFWDEFKEQVDVRTAREVTQTQISSYYDLILAANQSPTYAKHRFGAVKRVLNFARIRGVHPEEMRRLLDYCAVLQAPRSNGTNPRPISVEDFQALYNTANNLWKAMLLCALNFCMYAIEVSRIEKGECNLRRKTLATNRAKTGVTRVAVLWDRTVQAISELPATDHTHVFITRERGPYDAEGMRTAFRKLRKLAKVDDEVKFSHIRDGAYTAAIEGGADLLHAKLLGGHETGISDSYVRRNPAMVADACEAIERYYFGPPQTVESQNEKSLDGAGDEANQAGG